MEPIPVGSCTLGSFVILEGAEGCFKLGVLILLPITVFTPASRTAWDVMDLFAWKTISNWTWEHSKLKHLSSSKHH